MARDLTLLCTPAGFGKTTLLADWAASATQPVAWLSLDPDDSDDSDDDGTDGDDDGTDDDDGSDGDQQDS